MGNKKVVLAYSGGLDTSVAVQWLTEQGYDVVACCLDVGEGKDLDFIQAKALQVGAVNSYVIDAKEEFAQEYALLSFKLKRYYEDKYPLVSALSRPLISKKLVEVAHKENATAVAHGCTGKGNDQVRFEVAIKALDPSLEVIAPVREWSWSREEEIAYAKEKNIPIPIDLDSPYSDRPKLMGTKLMNVAFWKILGQRHLKKHSVLRFRLKMRRIQPDVIEIDFVKGVPVSIDGQQYPLSELILKLNEIGWKARSRKN